MHNINSQLENLRRAMLRVEDAADVMACPKEWAEVDDRNPVATWENGRQAAIERLRDLAMLAMEISQITLALPAYTGENENGQR